MRLAFILSCLLLSLACLVSSKEAMDWGDDGGRVFGACHRSALGVPSSSPAASSSLGLASLASSFPASPPPPAASRRGGGRGGGGRGGGSASARRPTPGDFGGVDTTRRGGGTPQSGARDASGGRRTYFDKHLALDGAKLRFEAGELLRGSFRGMGHSRRGGFVTPEGGGGDIYIDGEKDRNRAMDGDVVYVLVEGKAKAHPDDEDEDEESVEDVVKKLTLEASDDDDDDDEADSSTPAPESRWTDDALQTALWAPMHSTVRPSPRLHLSTPSSSVAFIADAKKGKRRGSVVCVDKSSAKALTVVGFVQPWSVALPGRTRA